MRCIVRPVLTLLALTAVAAGAPSNLLAQGNFEGEVAMTMAMPAMGQNIDVKYLVKGNKMRSEMAMMGNPMTSIIDMEAGAMLVLMPTQRAYMKMDVNAVAQQLGDQPPPKITATGRTETIVGKECEYYTIEQSGVSMETCVAKGMGWFNANSGGGGGMGGLGMAAHEQIWREAFKDGYFPLKMVMSQQGMTMEMTVTKMEEKSVPDSTFDMTVPEGYTQIQNPMGGGGRGGG